MGQFEELLEAIVFRLAENLHIRPRIRSAEGCANSDNDDIEQQKPSVITAGVI